MKILSRCLIILNLLGIRFNLLLNYLLWKDLLWNYLLWNPLLLKELLWNPLIWNPLIWYSLLCKNLLCLGWHFWICSKWWAKYRCLLSLIKITKILLFILILHTICGPELWINILMLLLILEIWWLIHCCHSRLSICLRFYFKIIIWTYHGFDYFIKISIDRITIY